MLENEADSAAAEGTGDQGAPSAGTTSRPRRRAASRPAGPPPEVDDTPAVIATPAPAAQAPAPATTASANAPAEGTASEDTASKGTGAPQGASGGESTAEEAAEAAPPKKTTRTRAARTTTAKTKAAKTTKAAKAAEPAEPAPEPAAQPAEEHVSEAPAAEPAAEEPARTTRSRTRKRAATTAGADTSAGTGTGAAVPPVPEVPVAPGNEPATGASGIASDARVSEAEPASGVGVPSVTFQPPMVVFQPPQPSAAPAVRPKDEPKAVPATGPEAEPASDEDAHADEDADEAAQSDERDEDDESGDRPSRRRRRRGGRGRGRGGKEAGDDESAHDDEADEAADEPADKPDRAERQERSEKPAKGAKGAKARGGKDAKKDARDEQAGDGDRDDSGDDDENGDSGPGGSSRRRRRRRRRTGADGEGAEEVPANTVVHVRDSRTVEDEVQSVRGSTRLEAKKQRRREGREQGRRRPPVITEAEFLARREAVDRVMVVRQEGERTQIAVLEDGVLVEHYVNRATHQSYVGNVYLGKVQNVLPSMEAAFVDVGKGRNAVLYAGEVNWDASGLEGQPRRIESALKSGQSVLVQVTKDPLGHKGARLTSQVSLPGRYLVYVPDGSMTGISRKLPDKERTRLKQILKKVMPENAGVIVRTAAEGATEEELARDVSRLAAQWDSIQKKVKNASAPSLLYGEPDLTIRVVRDIFNEDFGKLVVSGAEAWDTVSEYVEYVAPHLAERVERWDGDQDALTAFRIDEQIAKALDRKVWLPSGGSLVIDRTEAMTVIDVNTGKFTGQGGNLEETVTRNNLEAAEEIVRQLRLRDIGGIIVIDFIDMVLESNRDLVLRRLVECLSRDRTKHQVAEVTSLGLVQMTRKRVGQGLVEAFSETCESCNGRGIHVHLTPVENKPEKPSGKDAGGRRRKRKGEVEKAVEEKLSRDTGGRGRTETAEPVAASAPEPAPAKPRVKRGAAKRQAGPPEPLEPEPTEVKATEAKTAEAKATEAKAAEPESAPVPADEPESGAQATVDAADAAAEVTDAGPGVLDAVEPLPAGTPAQDHTGSNGAAGNGTAPAGTASATQETGAEGEAETEGEAAGNGRRRRTRRPRAVAQTAEQGASGETTSD
ncbi:Rne/Rng family ribonuclease [Spirillospora sp. NBC_01491]|uniref:Rne/Rng family ribonuclease n=1 Tax=Spirillospora sp. NBC_01491 TaxID=2976007 RepID=UPI002E36AA4D|nr:Rne/Rng family ribonuclease [Spirillospora sp. NBC_01491]